MDGYGLGGRRTKWGLEEDLRIVKEILEKKSRQLIYQRQAAKETRDDYESLLKAARAEIKRMFLSAPPPAPPPPSPREAAYLFLTTYFAQHQPSDSDTAKAHIAARLLENH